MKSKERKRLTGCSYYEYSSMPFILYWHKHPVTTQILLTTYRLNMYDLTAALNRHTLIPVLSTLIHSTSCILVPLLYAVSAIHWHTLPVLTQFSLLLTDSACTISFCFIKIYTYTCTIYTATVYLMHFRSFTICCTCYTLTYTTCSNSVLLTTDRLSLYHLTSAL